MRGLLNVQYALKDDVLYVLEANPRASRTVPFVSKATAVPLAKAAARIMLGATIAELRAEGLLPPTGDGGALPADAPIAVKEAVLPFKRFRTAEGKGVDSLLGPEMKSTGEVMGIDTAFGHAFAKSQAAAYGSLPTAGTIFVSVANRDKRGMIFPVKRLADLGFEIVATGGTAEVLRRNGIACEVVRKHYEDGPAAATRCRLIAAGEVALVINTPQGSAAPGIDGYEIRSAAVAADIPCITTVPGAAAAVMGIEALIRGDMTVRPLQELHAALRQSRPRATSGSEPTSTPAHDRVPCSGAMSGWCGRCCSARRRRRRGGARVTLRRLAWVRWPLWARSGRTSAGPRGRSSGCVSPTRSGWPPGMDKDGVALPAWPALGFGFVEVGTVTAHAQPGNARPRLFRLPDSEAVINRMGFNNAGAAALADRLAALGPPLGAAGHLAGQVQGHPAGRGGRRLPGVSAGAVPVRRLLRGQRQLAEHPGAAHACRTPTSSPNCSPRSRRRQPPWRRGPAPNPFWSRWLQTCQITPWARSWRCALTTGFQG